MPDSSRSLTTQNVRHLLERTTRLARFGPRAEPADSFLSSGEFGLKSSGPFMSNPRPPRQHVAEAGICDASSEDSVALRAGPGRRGFAAVMFLAAAA